MSAIIQLNNDFEGIKSLLVYKKSTGRVLTDLAESLLVGPSPLDRVERETIAAYVSYLNNCDYCFKAHCAIVQDFSSNEMDIPTMFASPDTSSASEKVKVLLKIAKEIQEGSTGLPEELVDRARRVGLCDESIHDTVLIASAFCMYNRYVDGLKVKLPQKERYNVLAKHLKNGYK